MRNFMENKQQVRDHRVRVTKNAGDQKALFMNLLREKPIQSISITESLPFYSRHHRGTFLFPIFQYQRPSGKAGAEMLLDSFKN